MPKNSYMISYNLQFFGKDGPGGEKTEEPTAKKLNDARDEGQVPKSMDLVTAISLLALFLILKNFIGIIGDILIKGYRYYYGRLSDFGREPFTIPVAASLVGQVLREVLLATCIIFIIAVFISIFMNAIQFKWKVTTKPLQPKLSKINPISGFKKIFSKDKLMELLKSVLKIGVISYVVYDALKDQEGLIISLYDFDLFQAVGLIGSIIIDLGVKISMFFLVIAIIDLIYQRRKFKEDMKMTKQEVKDEFKNSEGDPQIKGKIKAKMREASQRRMMQALPEADVVITNPTHLAVAIKYDKNFAEAPIVLAKGADYLAAKIKKAAAENKIQIVENKPLARMLYYNVEIGAEIPAELYQMVAEVLAYVYERNGSTAS